MEGEVFINGKMDRFVSRFFRKAKKCHYCGSHSFLTKDHFIPRAMGRPSRGGNAHLLIKINDPQNIVMACQSCNREKGNMRPLEWLAVCPDFGENFVVAKCEWAGEDHDDILLARTWRRDLPKTLRARRGLL